MRYLLEESPPDEPQPARKTLTDLVPERKKASCTALSALASAPLR